MTLEHINPAALSLPTGYTHVVATTGRRNIFVSGQVALNRDGQVVGEGDLVAQARQAYENVRAALASAGAAMSDIAKQTTYVVDFKPEYRAMLADVRREYLGTEKPPASTLVGVQALALPQFMIEIEVIAAVD